MIKRLQTYCKPSTPVDRRRTANEDRAKEGSIKQRHGGLTCTEIIPWV